MKQLPTAIRLRSANARIVTVVLTAFWITGITSLSAADPNSKPVTLTNVVAPTANSSTEPVAEAYSVTQATRFLDSAALTWQKQRKCFTCHTNYAYLYARPLVPGKSIAHQQVRAFAEELVTDRWPKKQPRWDAEVIATAAALSFNDAKTTGHLHSVTRTALDRMWTVQKQDGGFDWLKCGWPPMESDDHYGVTLAALAVGFAPDDYATSDAAKSGMKQIASYLKANPAPTRHHSAMVLWASKFHPNLLTADEQQQIINQLSTLQKPDGGWALATLGDWKRADGLTQDTTTSDGYGTGFIVYVLHQAGVPKDDPRLKRGIEWLKSNQRKSGRWYTRSLNKDNKHYITHAGSAFAVMALAECDELE